MTTIRRSLVTFIGLVSAASVVVATLASDPPDAKLNPVSGAIVTTDSSWTGSHFDVRYSSNPGNGQPVSVFVVAASPLDDLAPRLAIAATTGDTWVTWWRDGVTDQVLVRKRKQADGSWGSERVLSAAGESSRHPEIVHDGTRPWVAFEADGAVGGRIVAVAAVIDEPDPIGVRTVLRSTTYAGDLDVRIQAESGHLWVTWIDDASFVGWSAYDAASGTWSAAAFETSADGVAAARGRVRTTVLGP